MSKKAVILSGGLGVRLKPLTNAIPKPLLPIGEKAILEIQIDRLMEFGFDEIILATNYKADYIENFFSGREKYKSILTISKEENPLGTAGPLKLVEDKLTEPFLVMNGDILTLLDINKMYDFAVNQNTKMTVGIKKILMPYSFGNIHFQEDIVTGIEEKPDLITYALAGVYILKPEVLKIIPPNVVYGFDHLIQSMLDNNDQISKYEIKEYWLDIGEMDDYEKAQEEYKLHCADD